MLSEAVQDANSKHFVSKCPATARDGGQEGPRGVQDELWSLATSCCPWEVLMPTPDCRSASHESFGPVVGGQDVR